MHGNPPSLMSSHDSVRHPLPEKAKGNTENIGPTRCRITEATRCVTVAKMVCDFAVRYDSAVKKKKKSTIFIS